MNFPDFVIGRRYRLVDDTPIFGLGDFPKGASGVVANKSGTGEGKENIVCIKMDDHFPDLDEWDNELQVMPDNDEEAGECVASMWEEAP